MGNAESDAAEAAAMARVETLRDQLADMERAVRTLHGRPAVDVRLLPHQRCVSGHIVACDDGVRVLLGPVVGRVDATTARVLLEIDRAAMLTCHVLIYDARTDAWAEILQSRIVLDAPARRPTVFRIASLVPGRQYRVVFSGIHREDAATTIASFFTPTRADGGSIQCAVVSGDDVYELEYGERCLWRDLARAIVDEHRVHFVLHLGGQVAMKRMFDKAWALLVRHAECTAPPVALPTTNESTFTTAWASLEDRATEILRSAYRTQWTMMRDKAAVLANASNLMLWSDWDIYPAFTTSTVFAVDHAQPTLEMQVLRTVVRSARRLYHEYQRALWDDDLDDVITREAELRRIAEQALATTARIYQLGCQIPTANADLELQKKRRDIDGARKAERHLRALEADKVKAEKMLVSFNQVLAPQAGEEFFYSVGAVGFLFVDMRSARVEAGGSQSAENEVLSNVQWASIERILEDETIQLLLICSESPLVDDLPRELRTARGSDDECDFKTWWGSNASAQQRLLSLLFEWKLQREGRDAVLLTGASNTRFAMKTVVRDTRLRTDLRQWMAGPLTARTSGQVIPSRTGTLFDRYAFEHSDVEAVEKSLLYVAVDAAGARSPGSYSVSVTRVDATAVQDPARVLLGPIVGHVDAISAVVLLEVDRTCDLVCVVSNVLTGQFHRVFQHFEANRPNSFFLNHLKSEHFYEITFQRIHDPSAYRCSFTTLAKRPSQYQLLVVGSMDRPSHSAAPFSTQSLWPWINDNVSTGLPFRGVDKMIHFESPSFDDTAPLRHVVPDDAEDLDTRETLMAKLREGQRLQWNMPGVRHVLARGSHLMLLDDGGTGDEDDDSKQRIVNECAAHVRLEYENLLLPPSKRVAHADKRLENPIQFVFGAFGLLVLPSALTKSVGNCAAFWSCVDAFLRTPLLSFVAIVSRRPIIEDSVEDVEEKARFDNFYRHTLAFHQQKLFRLLNALFEWQQQTPSTVTCDRRVVFVAGHHSRGFDSIVQDLVAQSPIPRLRQFVVGPFRQPYQPVDTKHTSLRMNVFPQGTLFEKYGYFHRFQRRLDEEKKLTTDADDLENPRTPSLETRQDLGTLLHLHVSQKPTIDDHSAVDIVPTLVVSDSVTTVPPPSTTAFSSDDDLQIQVVGPNDNESRWTLEPRHPEWLGAVISQPLSEQEEAMLNDMTVLLAAKAADIDVSFQRADALANGLVSADDRTRFVTHIRAGIEDFHKHVAGMAFRSQYPVVPSSYVINYTLQDMAVDNRLTGAIDSEQYRTIVTKSLQNAALFDARLTTFWS